MTAETWITAEQKNNSVGYIPQNQHNPMRLAPERHFDFIRGQVDVHDGSP